MPKKRKSMCRTHSAPAVLVNARPVKRKQWTKDQMDAAIESAKSGMAANRAAELDGVPKSTLKDRLSGQIMHGKNPGPRPYLDPSEEVELSKHLLMTSKIGLGKTRREAMAIVETVAKDKGF